MKYIVIRQTFDTGTTRETPIIFPNFLTHSVVAKAIMESEDMKSGNPHVVAGGEFSSLHLRDLNLHGKSVSCKVDSRLKKDEYLIKMLDYMHGQVQLDKEP